MNIFGQFQAHDSLRFVAHGKISPARAKANVILALRKYFDDHSELENFAVGYAPEAVNVRAVMRNKWSKQLFNKTLECCQLASKDRMIHASQFVCPIWADYPHESVTVNYLSSHGELLLTATVSGEDCKAVVDDGAPFETLATKVKFVLTEAGKAARA